MTTAPGRRPPEAPRLSPSRRLAYSFVVGALVFAGLELAARVAGRTGRTETYGAVNWIVQRLVTLGAPDTDWIADPDLLWRLRPRAQIGADWPSAYRGVEMLSVVAQLNSYGWRAPEIHATRRPAERRVLHVGDSCTFGVGVPNGETYADRLPALLEARDGRSWESINAGVMSYSSYQARKLLEHYAPELRPDVVTVYVGWNDASTGVADAANQILAPTWCGYVSRALYRSAAFDLSRRIAFYRLHPELNTARVSVGEFRGNLRAIVEQGRRDGYAVVLVVPPAGPDPETMRRPVETPHHAYVTALRELASETATPVVDAEAIFATHAELLFHDPIHPSSRGHAVIAEALADALVVAVPGGDQPARDRVPDAARRE